MTSKTIDDPAYREALRKTVYRPSRYDDQTRKFVGGEWVIYGDPVKDDKAAGTGKPLRRPIVARGRTRHAAALAALRQAQGGLTEPKAAIQAGEEAVKA